MNVKNTCLYDIEKVAIPARSIVWGILWHRILHEQFPGSKATCYI